MTRRLLWIVPVVLLLGAAGYSGWLAWQVKGDLEAARAAATDVEATLQDGPRRERDQALDDLREATSRAHDRTDGAWWGAMTLVPVVGDDAEGVRALTASLDLLASDGAAPLTRTLDLLDGLTTDGGVDLAVLDKITPQVRKAEAAVAAAASEVERLDTSGYAGPVKAQFDEYVDLVTRADRTLSSAATATDVLPGMLGADGPRDYLLVFQNNAEIRATGGLPGSWALLHAEDGRLELRQQGTGGQFGPRETPLPMTKEELAVYDETPGVWFQTSNFIPDFPRAAELWRARWEENIPEPTLDGVVALDPVAMSYLLEGTGPVQVADRTLTPDNAVEELLSRPYLELEPAQQDVLFAAAARGIFDAMTGDLQDPVAFVEGLSRAAGEGRFLVAPTDAREQEQLAGTAVEGALPGDDGETPHVDIALNDMTMSKLSYYLRYHADVDAASCQDGVQRLNASLSLSQAITAAEAARLPDSVTGIADYGTRRGVQVVGVLVYGPHGGTLEDIRIGGKDIPWRGLEIDGRPVSKLYVELDSTKDVTISWAMTTGEGQTGDVELGMTPSVRRGSNDDTAASAC
ncbi:DUF4012 domain-containing protein [Nocardioides sp. GCM10027113]|uniref:DUF4012 domain-containing protein n=1 Tax=unclassified Nocardioides TaxID=2615069 RepID=UPI00360A707C